MHMLYTVEGKDIFLPPLALFALDITHIFIIANKAKIQHIFVEVMVDINFAM